MEPQAKEIKVADKYLLGKKIGSGSFGDIYIGILIISHQHTEQSKCRTQVGILLIRKIEDLHNHSSFMNIKYSKSFRENVLSSISWNT